MSLTKNLGQVSGVFIGKTPPRNTSLIWYDDTPSQMCHKVFDKVSNTWKALSPDIVSNITYSELVLNAQKNGLCVGKHYNITDKSNVLALAITATKVQYYDASGNILIDDLGTNIQYHVGSSNLLIDDLSGVFNIETNKLVFEFKEETDINIETDCLFGKSKKSGRWFLSKFSFSSLISKNSDNSISWKKGIFFSFKEAIKNMINKNNGVVGYDDYSVKITKIDKSITDISKNVDTLSKDVVTIVNDKTKDSVIYSKKIQSDINTSIAPADVILGDTLYTIISKFQRWINKFKYAKGISISKDFADASSHQFINNNDTVESAFSKIQYSLKNISKVSELGATWMEYDPSLNVGYPKIGDTLEEAIRKIILKLRQIGDITSNGVTCHNPFSWKIDINESEITSERIGFKDGTFNGFNSELTSLGLKVRNSNDDYSYFSSDGIRIANDFSKSEDERIYSKLEKQQLYINNESESYDVEYSRLRPGKLDMSTSKEVGDVFQRHIFSFNIPGFEGLLTVEGRNSPDFKYDAYLPKLKTDSITTSDIAVNKVKIKSFKYDFKVLGPSNLSASYYIAEEENCIRLLRGQYQQNLYLPNSPGIGTIVLLYIDELNSAGGSGDGFIPTDPVEYNGNVVLYSQGGDKILNKVDEDTYSSVSSVVIPKSNQGLMRMYIYTKQKTDGYWQMIKFKD